MLTHFIFVMMIASPGIHDAHDSNVSSPVYNEAQRIVQKVKSTTYQHQTDINEEHGKFNLDCSGFINYILNRVEPDSYRAISFKPHKRPLAEDYFKHFEKSPPGWTALKSVKDYRAGDILVWLKPPDSQKSDTGHIMIVRDVPKLNPKREDEWLVPVIDSTSSRHAEDSRQDHQNGVGTGTIGLVVNQLNQPIAYRWRGGESKKDVKTKMLCSRLKPKRA